MAKNKRFELDDFGFDSSLDMPDFSFDAPKIKDDRKAATKVAHGVIGGMKDRAVSPSFIRGVIKSSLPRGYGSAMDMADQTAGTLKSLYNDAAVEIKPVIKDLKRVTKRVMPAVQAALPRSMAAKIKKWSESDSDRGRMSEDAQREAGLQMQMSDIFQFQTKAQLQKDAENEARESIKDGIDHSRHRDMLGQLDAMRVSLQQLASYQNKVESGFQRKSLELQFRHYFVAMDALSEQKRQNVVVQTNLEGILKNTGLPDFVKMRAAENLKQIMRNKFMDGVSDTMFGKRRDFIKNLGTKLVTAAKDKIKNTASDFRSGLGAADMALDARDMQSEMGGGPSGLETVGGMVGSGIADSLGKRAGKKLRGVLGKNEALVRGGNKAQLLVDNAPQMMMDYARSNKHETGGMFDGLIRGLKDAILATGSTDNTLTEGSLDSAGSMLEPQPQTRGANKALTEIIPGFLARIYRELKIIRTGDDKQKLTTYDYTSNTFNDKNTAAKNVFKAVVKDADRLQTHNQIDDLLNRVDPEGKMNPEQRKVLGQHLLRDNMKMGSGTKARLTNADTFMVGKAGRHASKYADLFSDFFANDKSGEKEVGFARDYSRLGDRISDSRKAIQDHANAGNREHLEAAGLLDKNGQRINSDKLYDYFYGDDDFNPTDPQSQTRRRQRRPGPMGGNPTGGRNGGGLPPVPPTPAVPNPTPPPSPSRQVEGSAELIRAINESSSKTMATTISETLLRMEKKLNEGIDVRGGGPGEGGQRGGRWWNRSVGSIAGGLASSGANAFGAASRFANKTIGGALSSASGIVAAGMGIGRDLAGAAVERMRGFKDVYIKGEVEPRLLLAKMQMGLYRDQATGKVITRFKDIKGAVVDEAGNIVLQASELKDAFIKDGVAKKALSAMGALINTGKALGQSAMAGAGVFYNGAFQLAKQSFSLLSQPQDVYVRGRTEPALLATIMRAGGYFSKKTGKKITHPGDIDGAVVDNEGNVVLSSDELKGGVLDKFGKPIRVGMTKLLGMATDMIGAGLKKVGAMANWLGDKVKGGVDNVGSFLTNMTKHGITLSGGKTMVDRLTEIRDLLKDRLPQRKKAILGDSDGDGDRDGSFQDIMSHQKKKEAEAAAATAGPQADGAASAAKGGGIMSGLKGLYNKLRGKKDDDGEGSSGVDINIGGNGSAPGVPKPPKGPVPKGFWGKTAHYGKAGLRYAGKLGMMGLKALPYVGAAVEGASMLGIGGGLAAGAAGLATGGAAIGGALLTGGAALLTGIGAVLASPVVLGALAVAAVGAAGYYGYKYLTKKRLDTFSKIRYAQYGFLPTDEDHLQTVMGLEDQLKGAVTFDKDGAHIDDKKVDIKKMMQSFDIDLDKEQAAVDNWLIWFANRFKPVYLTHMTAMRSIDPKADLDGVAKLTPEQQVQYLKLVKFPDGPYNIGQAPFAKMRGLQAGGSEVKALVEAAETEIAKLPASKNKGSASGLEVAKPAAVAAAAATAGASAVAASKPPAGLSGTQLTELNKQTDSGSGLNDSRGVISVMGVPIAQNKFAAGRVAALACVRFKVYGLKELALDKVRTIDALETAVLKDVIWAKGNVAGWKGSVERLLLAVGPSFGVEGTGSENADAWLSWFNLRFLPVYLKYLTSMATLTNKQDPVAALNALKPQQQLDVAMEIYTTQSTYSGRSVSVWQVPSTPWPGYETNSEVTTVDANVQALKDAAKQASLDEQKGKTDSDLGSKQATPRKAPEATAGSLWDKATKGIGDMARSAVSSITGLFTPSAPATSGGFGAGGGDFAQPGKGTGGDINTLPLPTGNGTYAGVKGVIDGAAKMVGVDPKLMASMAAVESGFNYNIKSTSSPALGLFQFMPDTWAGMMKKHAAKYGIDPATPPTDPRANALLGAEYIKENSLALKGALNRPVNNTDVYMAHFLGGGGARTFFKADPNAIAATVMPGPARQNVNIFYDKAGRAKTIAEVYDTMGTKLSRVGKQFGLDLGSEQLLASSPAASTSPAGAPTAVGAAAPVSAGAAPVRTNNPLGTFPVADQAPTITNATPAPSSTGTTPVIATAAAVAPTSTSVPAVDPAVAAMSSGFVTPRSRDLAAQSAYQKDVTSEMMGNMVTAQQTSNTIQQKTLDAIIGIASMIAGRSANGNNAIAAKPIDPVSSVVQSLPQQARPVQQAPVSMAKPVFG